MVKKLAMPCLIKKIAWQLGDSPTAIIKKYRTAFATESIDNDQLETAIDQVITANPEAVTKFKAGKTQVIGFLLGQSMRIIGKKVDPNSVRQVLLTKLK